MANDYDSILLRGAQDILTDCRSGVITPAEAIRRMRALFDGSIARQAMATTSQDFVWHGSRRQMK